MLVHALASFAVFLFGLGPFTFYYGAVFILFELSTPFLNVHWFMDKVGLCAVVLHWICVSLSYRLCAIVPCLNERMPCPTERIPCPTATARQDWFAHADCKWHLSHCHLLFRADLLGNANVVGVLRYVSGSGVSV